MCRVQWVFSAHYWWPRRMCMSWRPCGPCWHSLHTVLPTTPRGRLPAGVSMLNPGPLASLRELFPGKAGFFPTFCVLLQWWSLPSLYALEQLLGSWIRFPLHPGKSYFAAWPFHMGETVQGPWPFPISMLVTGDWRQKDKNNRAGGI